MMTSENTFPLLLKRVDELVRIPYSFLQDEDEVYFLGEYTSGGKSAHSQMNQLIINYKKSVSKKGLPEFHYKEQAIKQAAQYFRASILSTSDLSMRFTQSTLVPVPPSLARDSSDYDDRNHKMLKHLMPQGDVRELYLQKQSRTPLHQSKTRDPSYLLGNYYLNEGVLAPKPKEIWIFDDVLKQGTHFRAAHTLLKERFPDIPIVGFFIARAIPMKQPQHPDFKRLETAGTF